MATGSLRLENLTGHPPSIDTRSAASDPNGTVIGARGLGQFTPDPVRRARPHAGTGAARDVVQRATWRLGLAVAIATALIGAGLGTLPGIIGGDPATSGFRPMVVTAGVMLLFGIGCLGYAWWQWRLRDRVLTRRGTAYVIDELSDRWTYEDKRAFLVDVAQHFAAVLHVPGPVNLGQDWDWPLSEGAERWDEHVDVLVRSFWSVQFNDDQVTDNALFVWAWWPVALAFAARATTGRRGMQLRVRHRPSIGRGGTLEGLGWRKDSIRFIHNPSLPSRGAETAPRTVHLNVTPALAQRDPANPASQGPVTLLLVRMLGSAFGPLTLSTSTDQDLHFEITDAAGTGLRGLQTATLREWRCVLPEGRLHPWEDYQALAQAATTWIARTSQDVGGTVILGMLVPPEVALGIGVLAGSTPQRRWPTTLWPIHFQESGGAYHPVIPGLDLGYQGLRPGPVR